MKIAKVLLSIAIMGLVMNMSASVRINGFGSYFEYLIPDTETDIELFPSHLNEFESRYVQIFNNVNSQSYDGFSARNVNLSIVPLASKLSFRINADIASNNDEPRIYLEKRYGWYGNDTYFDGYEFGAALVTNSLSYELTDIFLLGCFVKYGVNWKENVHDELEIEDPDLIIHEDIEDIDYDSDYLSTGINLSLESNFKTDFTLIYSKNDTEDFLLYKYDYERINSYGNEIHSDRSIREISSNFECEIEDVGVSVLLESEDTESVNRFFIESHYIKQTSDYQSFNFSHNLDYYDNELDYERKYINEELKLEEMEIYTATLGYGKTITKDKWNIYYGVKLYGMFCETVRDESSFSFNYYQNINPDTTYTDTISVSGENNFEIKDWKVAIEVPFGVSYKLNRVVQFSGGMGLKLIRQELEYFEDNEFSRWETDRYIAFGTTLMPYDCLKIDVNFGSSFASFKYWQIDLKYLW